MGGYRLSKLNATGIIDRQTPTYFRSFSHGRKDFRDGSDKVRMYE